MPAASHRPPFWYRSLAAVLAGPGAGWGQRGEERGRRERSHGTGSRADLWVHAASVGESVAAIPVVREIRRRRPAERLYLSALTPGGRAAWRRAFPDLPVGTLPFDAPGPVAAAVSLVSAQRVLLFETELWPEWLGALRDAGARLAVANARLTPASLRAYGWAPGLFRRLAGGLLAVAAQSAADAGAWRSLGVPEERVAVTGNTKLDALAATAVADDSSRERARAELGLEAEPFWVVAGSLRPGEERWLEVAAAATEAEVRYLIVPRHPERWSGRTALERHPACRWVARLGVLATAYEAADVAILGGTLEPYGGHNPAEAAHRGVPLVIGPHTENCAEIAEALVRSAGAVRITSAGGLAPAIENWRHDAPGRRQAGLAARRVVADRQGASARTVDWLEARGFWD